MSAPLDPAEVRRLAARILATGPDRDVIGPATGEPIARLPTSSRADVAEAFRRARVAAPAWAATPPNERAAVLHRFGGLVLDRRDELVALMAAESGKTRRDAVEELADVVLTARYLARTGPSVLAPRRRRGAFPGWPSVRVAAEPLGVVGVVSPWNYPLTLAVSDGLAAVVAGNAVVAAPDGSVPLIAARAAEMLASAGVPEGVWNVVCGDGTMLGPELIAQADGISFTGSTRVGRSVAMACADRLIPAVLELGGKNAVVVTDDVELDAAIEVTLRTCFANAGQLCMSAERVYVLEPIAQRFAETLAAGAAGMTLAPLHDTRSVERVLHHVEDAVGRGARVLAGGRPRPDLGPFAVEPTVLVDVPDDAACVRAESFGPVVVVRPVADVDEAVDRVNDSEFGLHHVVLSGDPGAGLAIADRLHAGSVSVNDGYALSWGSTDAPLGGWGRSGIGHRHGREGILGWTRSRAVATGRPPFSLAAPAMGEKRFERVLVAGLRGLGALGRR